MGYKVGDMVVYPRHGAARVEAITERTVRGVTREYLELSVLSADGLVINVPVDNAKKVGVRDIVDANEVAKVFEILRTPIIEKEMNWSRRYKLNVEKIATGDVNNIAEVVRDLAQRDVDEHGLSAGEKRMLTKARSILTSEIALSEKIEEALDAYISDFPIMDTQITYDIQDAEDKDWNQEWEEQGFAPIFVDDQVVIYDAKHPELYPDTSNRPDIIEIGIEAKLAFGTGNHETTRMIISQLLQMPIKTKRILDCGTGTGILGLTSSKLGAKDVVGYDIDEWSVENAKHNAVLNGVDNMEVFFGNSSVLNHVSGVFDVVMANINRNILLEDMKLFRSVMNIGGSLILSGFYEEDIPVLLENAAELGLHETNRHVDNNWACLVLGE